MDLPHVELTADGKVLAVRFRDGSAAEIPAAELWTRCPSAHARRARLDGRFEDPPTGISIVRVVMIGNYAVNIAFSDGRERGVYPWSLLKNIAHRPTWADYIHAA
jgi:DUF971 family protein